MRLKNFYLKGVIDGRKTNISASSNDGMSVSFFVKDENNESEEVVYINCYKTRNSLKVEVISRDRDTIYLEYPITTNNRRPKRNEGKKPY